MSALPVSAVPAIGVSPVSWPTAAPAANLSPIALPTALSNKADVPGGAFDTLVQQIQSLSTQMSSAAPQVASLAVGQTEGLETVLLNMERTRLQFDVLMSVRNRLLEAYQDLMRMQV